MQPSSNIRHGSRHAIVNAPDLPTPIGFSHAVVAAPGRLVFLGGQIGCDQTGEVRTDSLLEQFDLALANVARALASVGGEPGDLTQMLIYVTSIDEYRSSLTELGVIYRRHFGRHYAATALLGVAALFDPRARLELVCAAVVSSPG